MLKRGDHVLIRSTEASKRRGLFYSHMHDQVGKVGIIDDLDCNYAQVVTLRVAAGKRAYWWDPADLEPFGKIEIPGIGVVELTPRNNWSNRAG